MIPSSEHSRWSIPTPPVSLPENSNITALDLALAAVSYCAVVTINGRVDNSSRFYGIYSPDKRCR